MGSTSLQTRGKLAARTVNRDSGSAHASRSNRRRAVPFMAGTALAPALALALLYPAPGRAQTIPGNNTQPIVYSNTGTSPPAQTTIGAPGDSGGAGASYTIDLQTGQSIRTDAVQNLVSVSTTGGQGADSGQSNSDDNHDGPTGGAGGDGGAITVNLDAPSDSGAYSVLESFASNGNGVALYSRGGDAGGGGDNVGYGNGGIGGNGGAGGALTFTLGINPNFPTALTFIEGQSSAVYLNSSGGSGGSSGETGGALNSVTGRKGGAGGAGGNIDVTVAGNINGYGGGSGITAISLGGDGGAGGDASNESGKAVAANGGDAGIGGDITINVTGGAVTAQGPAQAGTGPVQDYDNSTDPHQTVPLDTSVVAGAILAASRGGEGGVAGEANGIVTEGGNGAAGGAGGSVNVNIGGSSLGVLNNNAVLSTSGYGTFGAMALSAGGDGGGGDSGGGVFFRSGGNGGTGGNGGSAAIHVGNDTATPYAKILTTGDDSDALVAISVGGGGGYSGDMLDSGGGAGLSIYMGGIGGKGGDAEGAYIGNGYFDPPPTDGSNAAFHPGDVIITSGTFSRGMVAQSVGGGGGRGGDVSGTSLLSSVTIGGSGGSGGTGYNAMGVNFGLISTSGSHSAGIFSQSVGGGGGAGGGALSRAVGQQISASFAIGGRGGSGGDAGEADGYNVGQVQTLGTNAHALFVQSVGGGGGLGGSAIAQNYNNNIPDEPSIAFSVAVGGRGGAAGRGNTVDVMNSGLLQTQGQDAYGVFAQSVGGGGGAGGDASATNMAVNQAKLTVDTSIGGAGGGGGDGGTVAVRNSGLISTSGATAIGVFAQSVGGGGGTGGFGTINQGSYNGGGDYSLALNIAVGGQGGVAGNGNDVTVANYISANASDTGYFSDYGVFSTRDLTGAGAILTAGDLAPGIFAQSIGGGGGNGGDGTGKGGNGQMSVNVAIGGNGGAGGNGGNVTVDNGNGAIQTNGAQSYGVFAQSVGGGGGTGGSAVTGSGDDPQYAYPEQALNIVANGYGRDPSGMEKVTDYLWDWKDNVQGAWSDIGRLQELFNLNNDINTGGSSSFLGLKGTDLSIDVGGGAGGTGGAGGAGGTVLVQSHGSIATHGAMSHAIFAQSVGGGGGVGGGAAPASGNDQIHVAAVQAAIAVGGQGGRGGNGGSVTVDNDAGGQIETSGDLAMGILAQSVGGGGGVGGATTPNAGIGNPMALSFGAASLDANSAVSGKGGSVNVNNAGIIQTRGDHGIGIFAESVGGGGGIVAVTGQTRDTNGLFNSTTQTLATGTVRPQLAQNWGGTKNVGGDVAVTLQSQGQIETEGVNAFGILAQSVGGGGGLMVVDPNNQVTVNQLATNPDNVAPSGGNRAGLVNVITQGQTSIVTDGDGAVGIVAQSLGGAGVLLNGFDGVDVTKSSQQVYQDRWDMGMGGAVTVQNSSDITTSGEYAHGIFAQVASGTGGVIGRTDGTGAIFRSGMGETMYCGGKSVTVGGDCGGAVMVGLDAGTITVSGNHSWGVVAESENVSFQILNQFSNQDWSTTSVAVANGARVLAIANQDGTQRADGAILLNGSGGNSVGNLGLIDGSQSATGYAIATVGRSYSVLNLLGGVIRGSFGPHCSNCAKNEGVTALADAGIVGTIDNAGTIDAGPVVDLGSGQFTNHGTLNIGGAGTIARTQLTGDLVQQAGGTLNVDADMAAGSADMLSVSGRAVLGGTVNVQPSTVANRTITVLTAGGGVSLDPQLAQVDNSALFDFPVSVAGNDLQITPIARFSDVAAGLGGNQRAVAASLQSRFDSGAAMDRGFTALAGVGSQEVGGSLNMLAGQALGAISAFRYASSRAFVGSLHDDCDGNGTGATCVWGRFQAISGTQDATADAFGYSANARIYQMGVQRQIGANWQVGASLGYEHGVFRDTDGGARISGDAVLGGLSLRYTNGALELSGAIDGAYGWYDSSRTIAVGGLSDTAIAHPREWEIGAHLHGAYRMDLGASAYLRPFADLHVMNVHANGFVEQGSSPFNLDVAGQSRWSVSGAIGTELGMSIGLGNGWSVRPYASAAIELNGGADWTSYARFADQSSGDRFAVTTGAPSRLGRFAVGASLLSAQNVNLSVSYSRELGDHYHTDSAVARLTYRF